LRLQGVAALWFANAVLVAGLAASTIATIIAIGAVNEVEAFAIAEPLHFVCTFANLPTEVFKFYGIV